MSSVILIVFVISIVSSFGAANVLVGKRHEWPVRNVNVWIRWNILRRISLKLPAMLKCITCSSMWVSLIIDIYLLSLFYLLFGQIIFLWPLTGLATAGINYFLYELLYVIEHK